MDAVAIHTVHLGREEGKVSELTGKIIKPAKIDEYSPGHIIENIDQKHFDDLSKLGAVRQATDIDRAVADSKGYVDPQKVRAAAALAPVAQKPVAEKPAPAPVAPVAPTAEKTATDNLLG